ncbi:MAG: PhzF family phenazine biosynthesis protein [Candidatus Sulfotelmatobacter sp.]
MRIPVFYVDAFTDRPFSGNPAAVCLLDSWLDDEGLHKVAAENNLSAAAFLLPKGQGYEIRWFTARCELKLCGHATLASGFVVLNFLQPAAEMVRFESRFHGTLTVEKSGDSLSMNFPALFPQPRPEVPRELTRALSRMNLRPSEVWEVNQIYMLVLEDQRAVQNMTPDFEALQQLHPHAVLITATGEEADFVSRYLAPGYGIAEDPVTGSSHCLLTPYWSRRLGKSRLHARQLSQRGGELWCEMAGDRVLLQSRAVLTMRGTLSI